MKKKGKLYLIPVTLGAVPPEESISAEVLNITRKLRYFIAENERSARRYLKVAKTEISQDHLVFGLLNKHTSLRDMPGLIKPLLDGRDVGLISEAGMPGIADPGSKVVSLCHSEGIRVVPCTGPSSILLALVGSGFNGQQFAFHGYLPIDKKERVRRLKQLEHDVRMTRYTQIFMETPFRNQKLLEDIFKNCLTLTPLCIAVDLTLPTETVQTKTVGEWKKNPPDLNKRPAIFLIGDRS